MPAYREIYIRIYVTGESEEACLETFFHALCDHTDEKGDFSKIHFKVVERFQQFPAKPSTKTKIKDASREEELGIRIRADLRRQQQLKRDAYVIILDDLEWDRREAFAILLERYLKAYEVLPAQNRWRGSAFYLIMMLEAYFWADLEATSKTLQIELTKQAGDPEAIRHPKNDLNAEIRSHSKNTCSYKEIDDSLAIARAIDLKLILSDKAACCSLRAIVRWCTLAAQRPLTEDYQLQEGQYDIRYESQFTALRSGINQGVAPPPSPPPAV
jgi:hypothetical protein